MNRKHLTAFLWLRWRMLVNQSKRAGPVNAAIAAIFAALGLAASLSMAVGGILLGALGMPHFPPTVRLLVWVGLIVCFLFVWLLGLATALQRSEALSLDKVLHLPVSPSGAFFINYVSSFFSISLILFVPGMCGLILGEVIALGPLLLLAFPLLASFVFAATALTYQFQGWIASLMSNPRRRRTIIVLVTAGIVLLVQLPNLINLFHPWQVRTSPVFKPPAPIPPKDHQKTPPSPAELMQRNSQRQRWDREQVEAREQETLDGVGLYVRLVCGILPPGWVALGAEDLAEGHILVALLGTVGLTVVGTLSLLRAYRTTMRLYTQGDSVSARERTRAPEPSPPSNARLSLLEWKLPGVPEGAAAVALATFRSLARAPEAKMLLLTPFIMLVVLSGVASPVLHQSPPEEFAPFVVLGMLGMLLTFMTQLVGNIFGFDRDGFRLIVLSPVPRREVLLGKNLAVAPIVLAIGVIAATAAGIVLRLRWDHLLAAYVQLATMYLYYSLLGNLCSIYAPFVIPAGSLKGARPDFTVVLAQLGCMALSPLVLGLPAVAPMLIELAVTEASGVHGLPISLGLSAAILAATAWLYGRLLTWEGRLLATRERQILDAIAKRAE